MRKRERENPCGICGHYHDYEKGEICGICGHRKIPQSSSDSSDSDSSFHLSAFPSEILPDFLYLGSYDNASRSQLLKTLHISRILNTVPSCQNLYKNSFTYHCLQDDQLLAFDDAVQFLELCQKDKARVLVHCMSGKNRSPAIVIAYLMKTKRWRLQQSYQWVKERRPSVDITQAVSTQLQEYEQKIFGPIDSGNPAMAVPSFSFGFPMTNDALLNSAVPIFNNFSDASIFTRLPLDIASQEFTFGASQAENPSGSDIPME
ncbi:hypothetical protein ACFE04_018391 [Oxalis oulophora]